MTRRQDRDDDHVLTRLTEIGHGEPVAMWELHDEFLGPRRSKRAVERLEARDKVKVTRRRFHSADVTPVAAKRKRWWS